ncbi:MAG: DUF885 domain-containing protein [Burkholderiales bacterium]|nr:DUF885 domain-containing protein [Burkholderiales bacterium]
MKKSLFASPILASVGLVGLLGAMSITAAANAAETSPPAKAEHTMMHKMADTGAQAAPQDAQMTKLGKEFLADLWRNQPEWAMYVGKYEGAAQLTIPDAADRARQLAFNERWLARFAKLDPAQLSPRERTDLAILQNQLKAANWELTKFKEYAWNPSNYNVAGAFDLLLNTEFAAKEVRLQKFLQRLQNVPAYYVAARASIDNPTLEHTELAIQQSAGAIQVLKEGNKQAQASKLSAAQKQQFASRTEAALKAVEEYVSWLRSVVARGEAKRSFRIGKEMYEEKFALQIQSGLTGEQIYQRALQAKEEMLARMDKITDELWPKYLANTAKPQDRVAKIGLMIDKLSEKHTTPDKFVEEVRQQLPILQKWLIDKNLLGQDASKPLEVRDTPEYERGFSVASIEAPGPYRPQDRTYYNVSPMTDMKPEQAESHLREYNHWILQILSIHEAIPGHYTQLVYANKSPSLIKTLFGNGTMIEGWAVYGERMMMESGYGDNAPEMWLMYSKWNLRAICNTILDYGIHVQNLSKEDAMRLMMRDAFQSEAEASGKWRRAQLSSVQLASYYSGYSAIMALREERRQQLGAKFDLKQFHEQFLSYGSAPVPMIRELMMASTSAAAAAPAAAHSGMMSKEMKEKHQKMHAKKGEEKKAEEGKKDEPAAKAHH